MLPDNDQAGFGKAANSWLFALSLIPVILFLFVLVNRIALPFALEWGEGAGVNQLLRILSSEPLYAPPDSKFAALVYTPLYYYLSAGLALVTGNPLLAARLLSAGSAIGAAGFIGFLVWKKTRNGLASWLAGSFYLGCFALSDGFFDLARVDSLYVLSALMVLYAARKAKKPWEFVLFGIMLAAGFYIKQSFLILFVPYLIALLIHNHRCFWPALLGALVAILIPLLVFENVTNGWFIYYIFQLPREHGISIVSAINFWVGDTAGPLAVAILFAAAYFLDQINSRSSGAGIGKLLEGENWSELFLVIGFFLGTWSTRSTAGGGANNLMPLYAVIALGFGLGVDVLAQKATQGPGARHFLAASAIFLQFVGLIYNPFRFIPTQDEIAYNQQLSREASEYQKQMLIPYQSQLVLGNDGPAQIHIVNLFELTGYFGGEIRQEGVRIVNGVREDICAQDYSKIIMDQPVPWFEDQLELAYRLADPGNIDDFRVSGQMDWQLGRWNTYLPLVEFDQELCLETIALER